MKKIILLSVATSLFCFMSCSESEDFLQTTEIAEEIQIDGNCDVYSLENSESAAWSIVETPEWITPVNPDGGVSDDIELYVESNGSVERKGVVTVEYSNGVIINTTVLQSTDQDTPSIQRAYAVGWGFDVTSYMDSRGIKDQIFNNQKVSMYEGISNTRYTDSRILSFYGESHSQINNSLKAHMKIDKLKISAFEMGLEGTFGNNALSNSDRIFSWMRGTYTECIVENHIDPEDAQDMDLFTKDFAEERQKVIDANGSEQSIKNLISRYGTHHVIVSYLGGYLDYYFSSVVENIDNSMNITAAMNFGYNDMFKIKGDGTYKEAYNSLNTEKIEKFSVKGGEAIDLTNKIIAGAMDATALDTWLESLKQGDVNKYELVDFEIAPIWELFPSDIRHKIKNYIETVMYYSDLPVTRAKINNQEF